MSGRSPGVVPGSSSARLANMKHDERRYRAADTRLKNGVLNAIAREGNPVLALLDLGSQTPCNLAMSKRVRWTRVHDGTPARRKVLGFAIRGVKLSAIVYEFENGPVTARLRKAFPKLSQADWDATFRALTLLVSSTERYPKRSRRKAGRP
jgi:hypothetical protein